MSINPFDSFVVRPAKNGLIVESERNPGSNMLYDTSDTLVFNSFDDFVEWARGRTQKRDGLDKASYSCI